MLQNLAVNSMSAVRDRVQKTIYRAKTDIVTDRINEEVMLISRKTGIVVHEADSGNSHELKSWGRRMALYKECGENEFLVDSFHEGENEKKYKKFIRKNARFLRTLFGSEANQLAINREQHGLHICLDDDVIKLVSAEVRSEIYLPMAYLKQGKVEGGMYAYIWRCDASGKESEPLATLAQRPITAIVTGMCMFGTNIWGIDQHGTRHPLTNTFYKMQSGSRIQSIALDSNDLHPYENMMLRLFDHQMPMYKAMGQGSQTVFYQSVFEEYVLYGLQMLLMGQMSISALCTYVEHVRTRTLEIRKHVSRICEHHDMGFDNGESTLAALFGSELRSDTKGADVVERFINLHEVDLSSILDQSQEERFLHISQIFWRCLTTLSDQPGNAGLVWQHVEQTLKKHQQMRDTEKFDFSSLLTLNFLNYSVKIAVVRKSNPHGELCLTHPFHEKPMALAYKELHAERFGGIYSINWIPPIFTHGPFKDGLYYLNNNKEHLNTLINKGLVDLCGIEVGAEATGNIELGMEASRHITALIMPDTMTSP